MKKFLSELKDNWFFIPLSLFVFSFFLRLSLISKGPFSLDSLLVVDAALKTIETRQLQYFHDFRYPLVIILQTGAINCFRLLSMDDPIYAYNFLSVVISSLGVCFYYDLAQRLFDRPAAFFSAIILSVCPIYLSLSVYGTGNVFSLLFLFMAVSYLLRYGLEKKMKDIVSSAIFFGFMFAARMQDMIFLMPALFSCLFMNEAAKVSYKSIRSKVGRFIVYLVGAVAIGIAFYLPVIFNSADSSQLYYRWSIVISKIPFDNLLAFFCEAFFRNISFVIHSLSITGFVISVIGIVFLFFKKRKVFYFCFLWIIVPLLLLSCLKFTGPRLLVLLVPPFILSQGYLLSEMFKRGKVFSLISIALFVGISYSIFLTIHPVLLHRHQKALLPEYANKIGEISAPEDVIICHDEALFISYYAKRNTMIRPSEAELFSRDAMMGYKNRIEAILRQGHDVYSTWPGIYASEHPQVFEYLIKKHFDIEEVAVMPYEDWHRGPTRQRIYSFPIYKIKEKKENF